MEQANTRGEPGKSIPRWSRPRIVGIRLAAVLVGLSPFLVVEAALRLAGWAPPVRTEDPYVGFVASNPLFVLNREQQRYEIARSRQRYFRPESFSADKGAREFRIFCLGGSTVQGNPWSLETSFTSWLELSLRAADPQREWEVVNCGGISYATYRLAPILEELLAHHPDLFLIYTGQNEFLEDRTYHAVKQTPSWIMRFHGWLSPLRSYQWVRSQQLSLSSTAASRATLPGEVDALLDYRDGLTDYHRDDAWRAGVVEHFEFNLERMIRTARAAGVPVLLANPVSNLKDCPPFKYELSQELSPAQIFDVERLWSRARQLDSDQLDEEIRLLQEALAIDPRHAGLHFHLGKCYEAQASWKEARACFERARDEDICPLRLLGKMHEVIRDVARRTQTPLVDVEQRIAAQSPGGIPGEEWLVDHVHPSIRGYQEVAASFFAEMVRLGWVQPQPDWQIEKKQLFQERLDSLNTSYFARGQEHLEGLRRWSQGRAPKIKMPSKNRTGPAGVTTAGSDRTDVK